MRILLATDGSECSDVAVAEVATGRWPADSELLVVSVVEAPLTIAPDTWVLPPGYYDEIATALNERAEAAMQTAAARIREAQGSSLAVATRLLTGNPRSAIVEASEEWGADLVVVGSHGYRGFERFLLGSVSQAIAHSAPCSVEIVRSRVER
jgi:nucleotide-binding universal stress UspA family protein